jgi:primosomal protein N' (replication factor Y)
VPVVCHPEFYGFLIFQIKFVIFQCGGAIETASRHDYESFAKRELEFRQATAYPPYIRIARLLVWDKNLDRTRQQAEKVADQLSAMLKARDLGRDVMLGPAPCFFSRVRDDYRWHIALRHPDPASIVRDRHLGVQWRIDIDPVNML